MINSQQQKLKDRGICVIIPTYNNAGTIVDVVTRAMCQCSDVFVVCDGCTDPTPELLKGMSPAPEIVLLPVNRGKGRALKEGFRVALNAGFAYAIVLDSDGQHYPEDIPLFLEANIKYPGALIVGCREGLGLAERSSGSRFANSFSNFWLMLQTGHRLHDTQSGYRLYPLRKLRFLSLLTDRYEAELELLVLSLWKGVQVREVPVRVWYPNAGERVSFFRPGRDFLRISLLNTVLCVLALVYGLPRFLIRTFLALFRTYFSLIVFAVTAFFILTPAAFVYLTVRRKDPLKKEKLHRYVCALARFVQFKITLPGISYSQDDGGEDFGRPAIVISNHQSHLDLLPILALTPKLIILTADWVWHNPLYCYIIRNLDYLPASDGIDAILPRLRELVADGYSIAVYPESTRSMDCSIGRFHQGAFYLAQALDIDILPVVLYGAGRALPKHGRILRRWTMRLETDRRISPEEMRNISDGYAGQASYMRSYFGRRYSEIADKIEQTLK